LEEIRNDTER